MAQSIRHSHIGASHWSTVRLIRTPVDRPCPFWCDVVDTPWSKTLRNHNVAAALVSGPGVPRTWRFCSQT
jgi:hypothetical protein